MNNIHSTAIVSPYAKISENVKIGPFSIIHDDVEIGEGAIIDSHAVIYDGARLDKNVHVYQGASVANVPQDLKFEDEPSLLYVGEGTQIREFATLHRGTSDLGYTKVGKNCLLMAYSHVAHDCILGDNVILANCTELAGHVSIHDNVICGGGVLIHQFVTVGKNTMVGAGTYLPQDTPPYIVAAGKPAQFRGLNLVGLRRKGFTNDQVNALKKAYKLLYASALNRTQAIEQIRNDEIYSDQHVQNIVTFVEESKRGLLK